MSIAEKKIKLIGQPEFWDEEQGAILKVLVYFDIFRYPLTKNEISKFLRKRFSESIFERSLLQMLADQVIFFHDGFYSLHNNPLLVLRRKEGNLRAGKLLLKAFKIGRFLFYFPFVRAIGISGSLSKNFADEEADIDFFIITKANRLWITRTMMHLFKKLTFLTGHQHYFCMNYYIDEQALLIEDQNIFTAIEVATLLPVSGKETLDSFFEANNWCYRFIPGFNRAASSAEQPASPWIKRFAEWILDNKTSDLLDKWLLRVTTDRWQRKHNKGLRNKNGYAMQLITGRHFSRSNPGAFQEKILSLYEQKLIELKLL